MPVDPQARLVFDQSVAALIATEPGREASMYTVLRDLFTDVLG